MHGQDMRKEHLAFRGLLATRRPDLPQVLPQRERRKIAAASSEERNRLDKELQLINIKISQNRDELSLKSERSAIYVKRKEIFRKGLQNHRKEYETYRYDEEVDRQLRSEISILDHVSTSRFAILRRFLPERNRLADSLFEPTKLRSIAGQQILCDLLSLCSKGKSTLFRPGEEPVDGKCPFNECGLLISR